MNDKPKPERERRVVVFRPRPDDLLRTIRELARDTENIAWGRHARDRMIERDIQDVVAVDVIRLGYIKGEVEPTGNAGEWKVKLCMTVKGRREVGVVTIVIDTRSLFVKTVEWEDVR